MTTIYNKKEDLRKEYKILQREYLLTDDFIKFSYLRDKEQKTYNKYKFFKEYLLAKERLERKCK